MEYASSPRNRNVLAFVFGNKAHRLSPSCPVEGMCLSLACRPVWLGAELVLQNTCKRLIPESPGRLAPSVGGLRLAHLTLSRMGYLPSRMGLDRLITLSWRASLPVPSRLVLSKASLCQALGLAAPGPRLVWLPMVQAMPGQASLTPSLTLTAGPGGLSEGS